MVHPPQKNCDILSFLRTWLKLEVIMLSDIRQTQKDKYGIISVICGILKSHLGNLEWGDGNQRLHGTREKKPGEGLVGGYQITVRQEQVLVCSSTGIKA